ncbi:hypothetical protein ES705_19552 [subsurface metagenome]
MKGDASATKEHLQIYYLRKASEAKNFYMI